MMKPGGIMVCPPLYFCLFINLDKKQAVHGVRWNLPGSLLNAKVCCSQLKLLLAEKPSLKRGTHGVVEAFLDKVDKAGAI